MNLNKELYSNCREHPIRVVQFGAGNFMRAFADWMIDRMNKATGFASGFDAGFDAGVAVVQPLPTGPNDKINAQDGLFTLYLQGLRDGAVVREHSVVSCIRRAVNPYIEYEKYIRLAEIDTLRFVLSNTTEAGIVFEPEDRPENKPPKGFPAKLTAFLYHRYRHFRGDPSKGLIIIPCELIEKNGARLRELVLQYALLWELGEGFASWLRTANIFCSSLVDRIVPGYPGDEIEAYRTELGYEDSLLVIGEPYYLWVIEGPEWIRNELPTEQAGLNVVYTNDLTPYRTRKVRILNGAHTALTPVAYLLGLNTVGDAVGDTTAGRFLREAIHEEIIPTLDMPGDELAAYAETVLERFQNPFVRHQLTSIALNSVSKFKTRVLPSILEYRRKTGKLPYRLVFSLAALLAFYQGNRGEAAIPLQDEPLVLEHFAAAWQGYDGAESALRGLVTGTLGKKAFWDTDLNEVGGLADAVFEYLALIKKQGMPEAVKQLLAIK